MLEVLHGHVLTHGPQGRGFEDEFAAFMGDEAYCVAVSSGTAALHLAYFQMGLGPGDVRITTHLYEDYLLNGLSGTVHEAGHAMYEQGLPHDIWGGTGLNAAASGITWPPVTLAVLTVYSLMEKVTDRSHSSSRALVVNDWPSSEPAQPVTSLML